MKQLRVKFWKDSKKMIEWCGDEELRVLRNQAYDEIERRLKAATEKFDASEEVRIARKKRLTKRGAKKRNMDIPPNQL